MEYIWLYIKRTFTRNFRKQIFLICGIAAFMAMLSVKVFNTDSSELDHEKNIEQHDWGFSEKIFDVSAEGVAYLTEREEISKVDAVERLPLVGGLDNVELVVSSAVPETWKLSFLYGTMPKAGEVLLTGNALINKRQPVPGETVVFTVQVGEEKRQVEAVVSGVVEAFSDYAGMYAFLYQEDFETLTENLSQEERHYDVFLTEAYKDALTPVRYDFVQKFGNRIFYEYEITENYEGYSYAEIVLSFIWVGILCGGCLGAIIYLVLRDERKNIGILRALGARKSQITAMVTMRVLLSGGIGILLGCGLSLALRAVQKLTMYTDDGFGSDIGSVSLVAIPLGGLLLLLILQLPGVWNLLKEMPVELMNEVGHIGENLISMKGGKLLQVKHPLWWYAGLEGKRLRGQRIGITVIMVLGLFVPIVTSLNFRVDFRYDARNAAEETYTVAKEGDTFTREEVERILALSGVRSAGFSAEQSGEGLAEYNGTPITVRIQILDEAAFGRLKASLAKSGYKLEADSGAELLQEKEIIIHQTMLSARKRIREGEVVQLLAPSGEVYDCKVALMANCSVDVDAEYYIYLNYGAYCDIFGVPELQRFSVTLDGVALTEVTEALEREMQGVSIGENELLVGNTEEELNHDTIIYDIMLIFVSVLTAVAFLFCYNSFYYLAKTEEYRKLLAMGASRRMIKGIILSQALRLAGILAVVNVVVSYLFYRVNVDSIRDVGVREEITLLPLWELCVVVIFVMAVTMGTAWFASKQVLKELEQTA